MARAKRTERAEARRRHRAAFADQLGDGELEATDSDGAPSTTTPTHGPATARSRPAPSASAPPIQRPGITTAFRSSFRPLDLRGDLRFLPRLLVHRAFLAPTVASGLAFVLFVLEQNEATAFFYQYFSWQLPIAALFIGGFFAPRASYLFGAAIAIASLLFQLPLLVGQPVDLFVSGVFTAILYGSLFAAAASWYRRFLSRANPNRSQPSASSRRPDGKVPKKPQQRPMLARRR